MKLKYCFLLLLLFVFKGVLAQLNYHDLQILNGCVNVNLAYYYLYNKGFTASEGLFVNDAAELDDSNGWYRVQKNDESVYIKQRHMQWSYELKDSIKRNYISVYYFTIDSKRFQTFMGKLEKDGFVKETHEVHKESIWERWDGFNDYGFDMFQTIIFSNGQYVIY